MRILIIGGAGLIGCELEKILSVSHDTCIFDNFLSSFVSQDYQFNGTKVIGNSTNLQSLTTVFRSFRPEVVFHFADRIIDEEEKYNEVLESNINVSTTINLLKCIKEYPVKHIFLGSSSEVYDGNSKRKLKETSMLSSFNFSGITKRYCEELCCLYAAENDVTFTSLRFFQVYGNRKALNPKTDIVSFLIDYVVMGDPLFVAGKDKFLDLISVKSATKAVEFVLRAVLSGKKLPVVNIGSAEPISVKSICDIVISKVPEYKSRLSYLPSNYGTRSLVCNNSLLKSLGWKDTSKLDIELDEIIKFRKSFLK